MQEELSHFKTHICFVSAETMPNLLLCLDKDTKPEQVILLTSQEMISNNKYSVLADNFKKLGVKVEKIILEDISFPKLTDFIKEFIEKLPEKQIDIAKTAFNITCGTKLMTIAAFSACSGLLPMFYVDTKNNKLFLLDEKKDITLKNLCSVINILNSYGYRVTQKNSITNNNGAVITALLNTKETISPLNALASNAEKTLSTTIDPKRKFPKLENILKECEKAKLLSYQNDTIIFSNEPTREFCNGIWLEEHVFHTLDQLKKQNQIDDFEGALEVVYADTSTSNANAKPDNEFDALFVKNNILYLIECKTSKMDNQDKARSIFYKLDSLHAKIGGVLAKGILISINPLTDDEKKHAQKNQILVLDSIEQIKDLRKNLLEVIK